MRKSVPLLALVLAGCGGQQEERSGRQSGTEMVTMDASEEAADVDASSRMPSAPPPPATSAGPNVGPTAAPGVAFNYRYAFGLPAERVAEVQERHALACEELGINRCRITGMRYRVANERDIEAMLSFKLDPAIARRFGKAGVDAVVKSEGKLIDAEISGVDAGARIKAATKTVAELTEELTRIEQQLARPGLRPGDRTSLDYQAQQLRQQIRAAQDTRAEHEESLATTPMTFEYGAGDLAPGFETGPSISRALDTAGENFLGGLALLLILVITLLPWVAFALLAWLLFRLLRPIVRRLLTVRPPADAPAEPAPAA